MRSLLTLFFSLGATTLLFMACGTDPAPTESICDPGSNVFCRCRGSRESGTKRCNDAGDGFGPCENSYGECDEVEGTGTGGSSGVGPGTGGTPDPGELLAPCNVEMDQLCDEGLVCEHGYCTKPCESYEECLPLGDCVDLDGKGGRCAPLCVEQADCEIYGSAVACGASCASTGRRRVAPGSMPRTTISPLSPVGSDSPSAPTTRTSNHGAGRPTAAKRPSVLMLVKLEASVIP